MDYLCWRCTSDSSHGAIVVLSWTWYNCAFPLGRSFDNCATFAIGGQENSTSDLKGAGRRDNNDPRIAAPDSKKIPRDHVCGECVLREKFPTMYYPASLHVESRWNEPRAIALCNQCGGWSIIDRSEPNRTPPAENAPVPQRKECHEAHQAVLAVGGMTRMVVLERLSKAEIRRRRSLRIPAWFGVLVFLMTSRRSSITVRLRKETVGEREEKKTLREETAYINCPEFSLISDGGLYCSKYCSS